MFQATEIFILLSANPLYRWLASCSFVC